MRCLVFRIYGPMASWGSTAVGGVRPSATLPTRSAVLGLMAAAFGICRMEDERLSALSNSFGIVVKAESEGTLLRDYHTAQVPSTDKKALWLHRKAELEYARTTINTVLSTRDYRTDGHWVIGIEERLGATFSLEQLAEALKSPAFPLFLGRKSCPLAAPLDPRIVESTQMIDALNSDQRSISFKNRADASLYSHFVIYQWDVENMGIAADESREDWDQPTSRTRWQFTKRLVHSVRMERS